ncbi:unnamed protein product [Rotaria socialis]|uniref:Tetratricopeptide repeat protein n=2 Tax=Rotaria socialis TaxID=392032 RepID=A0A820UIF0_9BILA|nr:unnamed protein product [Rotaria socialis]CAF4484409.1 unnamed protein product [Rotaria socialis]
MVRKEHLVTHPNLMSIWYHDQYVSIDVMQHMKKHLYNNFAYSRIFSKTADLIDYLANPLVIKSIVFILSIKNEKEAYPITKIAKRRPEFRSLHILPRELYVSSPLPDTVSVHSLLKKSFKKIVNELQAEESSRTTVPQEDNQENMIGEVPHFDTFKPISAQKSFCDLNNESLQFLLFQSLIEALVKRQYEKDAFSYMWQILCQDYASNPAQVEKIWKLATEYTPQKAIHYYTKTSGVFRLINKAFRMEDVERIYRFGCYLADLHKQLEETGNEQRLNQNKNIKKTFRGKKVERGVVQQLKDSKGHVIALNGLLSTSTDPEVAKMYSGGETIQSDYQNVTFEMHIDFSTTKLLRPYADVTKLSEISDDSEVLFFTGFVWKIEDVEESPANVWLIKLRSCTDKDADLLEYIEEARRDCSYLTIGTILQELGDHAQASNFYQRMLKDENLTDKIRCDILVHQAKLAENQGEYLQALEYLKVVESVKLETASNPNQSARLRPLFAHKNLTSKLHIFYNMGMLYWKDAKSKLARQYFEAALQQKGSDDELATVLNSYGRFEFGFGNIQQALNYLQKAVQLAKDDELLSDCTKNLSMIREHVR